MTELRVHGVGGATPAALLRTTGFRQVWGDRIAGFYEADVDQRGRKVEAYCWGGMTSRSSSRVLWLLLFPFMLVNLAGWTCSARTRENRWAFAAHRAFGRLAALAVTLNLMLIASMISVDVWAYQFGGQKLGEHAPAWKKAAHFMAGGWNDPGQRLVIGTAVAVAALLALGMLSWQSRSRYEQVAPIGRANRRRSAVSAAALPDGVMDRRFFDGAATVRRLVRLHVAAGLAWSAMLLAYVQRDDFLRVPLLLSAAVLAAVILLVAFEAAGERLVTPLFVAAAVLLVTVAAYVWMRPGSGHAVGPPRAMHHFCDLTAEVIFVSVLLRLVVMPVIIGFRPRGPRSGTRWLGAPFVITALSVLSLNTVGFGSLMAVARLLGTQVWRDKEPYGPHSGVMIAVASVIGDEMPWLTLGPIVLVTVFVLVEGIRYLRAGRGDAVSQVVGEYAGRMDAGPSPETPFDHWRCSALPDNSASQSECRRRASWVGGIARARTAAGFGPDVRYLLGGVVALAFVLLAIFHADIWARFYAFDWVHSHLFFWTSATQYDFVVRASEWLCGLIPVAGLALLRSGWRRPEARRWLGVLWDVGTFWPRAYHPFSPPCYAERAVPDLQRRIRWLNDRGDRVVVVGHSQGSVLTAVALAQRTEPKEHEQPLLVTFGCPLVKLYSWAFPAYINRTFLDRVSPWRNFSYLTDYIGGPVGRRDVDMRLPDPDSAWYITGEPLPDMRRHTGYWSDEAMWRQIDELCAQSAEPVAAAAPGAPA